MTSRLERGGRLIALTPIGYQFGDPVRADVGTGNSKWLNIRVEASDGSRSWERVDACFSDWEMFGLVRWLRGVGSSQYGEATFEGLEPSLQFNAVWSDGLIHLSSEFRLEMHPDWSREARPLDVTVVRFLELTRSDLDRFADEIAADLRRFPEPRGP